jgi:tetratricopeptide (TPR) repeat protein
VIAEQYYSIYLSKFLPDEKERRKERNKYRMYLAEAKSDLGKPAEAAEIYKLVIKDQDPEFAKDAAGLWVGSLDKELKALAKTGMKNGAAPSVIERDFIEASDLLEKYLPDSLQSRESRLRSAQTLAAYPEEKKNAFQRAGKLVKDAPSTPQGVGAARLMLAIDSGSKVVEELRKNSGVLEADRKEKGELALDLEKASRELKVAEIKVFEEGQDHLKAAKAYEEFARSYQAQKEVEGALSGAVNQYGAAGKGDDVLRVMREWKLRFPKSGLMSTEVKAQANRFFIEGLFSESAEVFFGLGKMNQDRDSYRSAGELFAGAGKGGRARESFLEAVNLSKSEEDKAELHYRLYELAVDSKDDSNRLIELKTCSHFSSSLKAECLSRLGDLALDKKDISGAKSFYSEVLKIKKGPSSRSTYLAYAQFRMASFQDQALRKLQGEVEESKVVKLLKDRSAELKPIISSFENSSKLGGPWGIAAQKRLGEVFEELASDLSKIEQKGKYSEGIRQALLGTIETVRKQSYDAYRHAYDYAMKEGVLSPAIPLVQDRLVDFGDASLKRSQGARGAVKLIGLNPMGGAKGRDESFKEVRANLLRKDAKVTDWLDYGNLLWGSGKPGLSKIAYETAQSLDPGSPDARNNAAVVRLSHAKVENWAAANMALASWKGILQKSPEHAAALFNCGYIYNYYRLFELAIPYFEKVLQKNEVRDAYDGLAVAYAGLGRLDDSSRESTRAEEKGAPEGRFTRKFREAAGLKGKECLETLDSIKGVKDLDGFEAGAISRLRERCQI